MSTFNALMRFSSRSYTFLKTSPATPSAEEAADLDLTVKVFRVKHLLKQTNNAESDSAVLELLQEMRTRFTYDIHRPW